MKEKEISFKLNGADVAVSVLPNESLLKVLRRKLGFTGTKEGCGKGDCGACTVILDGDAVDSCLVLAMQVDGREVMTIEGLGTRENLHPLQHNFIHLGAIQCGFCTPGQLMSAKAFLDKNPRPTRDEIKVAISGNLCRCTGYVKIIDAIEVTAEGKLAAS